jgi:hypothetical protein
MADRIPMTDEPETTEPRIFVKVQRMVNGHNVYAVREISLLIWRSARVPGSIVAAEIDAMLREVS